MSTKIYNAFIFKGNVEELMDILKSIKKDYKEYLEKFLLNLNYSKFTFQKTRYPFLPSDLTFEEFKKLDFPDYLLEDIFEREKKRGEYHPFNINASAVVYFYEGKIYVQFFGLPRDFQASVINDKFQDCHYQNSTDMSNYDWDKESWNDMTAERQTELEKEWSERRRIWDNIMPDWSIPSECGLSFEFEPIGYELNVICNKILEK